MFRCLLTSFLMLLASAAPALAQVNSDERVFEAEFQRGYQFQRQGRFNEAVAIYEAALQRFPQAVNAPNSVSLLNNLGFLLIDRGRFDYSHRLFTTALEMQTKRAGPLDRAALRSREGLVLVANYRSDWQTAGTLLAELLEFKTKVFGRESLPVSDILEQQALNSNVLGQPETAAPLLAEAIRIREKLSGAGNPGLVTPLTSLAVVQIDLGLFPEADRSVSRATALAETIKDEQTRDNALGSIYTALGELCLRTGRYSECEAAYRAQLELHAKIPRERSFLASTALELAGLYLQMGLLDKSEAGLSQSAAYARQFGVSSPNFPVLLAVGWGRLYTARGNYDEAEKALLLARDRNLEKPQTSGRFDVGILDNLAVVYHNAERHAEAEKTAREAVAMLEARLPASHPQLARCQFQLGIMLLGGDKVTEAGQWCQRALAAERVKLQPTHPDLLDHLAISGKLAAQQGRWDDAVTLTAEARRGVRRYIHEVLPELSPAEQRSFLLNRDGWYLTHALSLSVFRPDDVPLRAQAAQWLLNAKGVGQQALAERTVEARTAAEPQSAHLLQKMQSVRRQRMRLGVKIAETDQESGDLVRKMQELAANERELAAQFAKLAGLPYRSDPWIELNELRGQLSADSVFVEFAKIQVFTFDGSGPNIPPAHYVAWIVPPALTADVQVVDLGLAAAIESAVQTARAAMEESPQKIDKLGRKEAERAVREPLAALAKVALEPILPHIGDVRRIELSPDADLWLVPWAALPLPDGRYAVEKYDVRYQISGRELASALVPNSIGLPVVFADPDYNLTPAEVSSATLSVLRKPTVAVIRGEIGGDTRGLHVNRLHGTAREAAAIAPALEALTKSKPQMYTDRWALEGVFKAVRRPSVLVASTHGFFLPDQELQPQANLTAPTGERSAVPLGRSGRPLQNPLARCGLLLAGCNQSTPAGQADDGILTGLEIVGTDLRGTQLVVLSACQTALGDLHRGEGVSGLRQAFQLAGAQAVIATLWQIDDDETADLMRELFANLAEGENKSAALRAAQLNRIAAHRERDGSAHPFYWAAFTLTGI